MGKRSDKLLVAIHIILVAFCLFESFNILYVATIFAIVDGAIIIFVPLLLIGVVLVASPPIIAHRLRKNGKDLMAKYVSIIGIILLIILGAYLYPLNMAAQPSHYYNSSDISAAIAPSPKVYRNDKYGFEFHYTNDWSLVEGKEGNPVIATFYPLISATSTPIKLSYIKSFANVGTIKTIQDLERAVKELNSTVKDPRIITSKTGIDGFDFVVGGDGSTGILKNSDGSYVEAYVLLNNGVLGVYPSDAVWYLKKI